MHALLSATRDTAAAQEAAILLQGEHMTPARAGELLARNRPAPLTARDLQCDSTAPTELVEMILTAKAKLQVESDQQNDETVAGLA